MKSIQEVCDLIKDGVALITKEHRVAHAFRPEGEGKFRLYDEDNKPNILFHTKAAAQFVHGCVYVHQKYDAMFGDVDKLELSSPDYEPVEGDYYDGPQYAE